MSSAHNTTGAAELVTRRKQLLLVSRDGTLTIDGVPVGPIFGSSGGDGAGAPEANGRIAPHHLQMLAASGIPPEHAHARGYETITVRRRLEELGIVKAARNCIPGLLIPLLRADGSTWGYQYRPDIPRWRSCKPVKYETPYQQRNGLDIPPGVEDLIGDPYVPLWVTEGVKKADCGAQYQLCIVALSGVWNWRGTNNMGGKTAVADWNDVALNDRRVILAFDGDVARKPNAAKALCALADFLRYRDASVEYLHLPDTDEKTGLDDYLVAGHTIDDLWRLVKPTPPPLRTEPADDTSEGPRDQAHRDVWPPPGDAYQVAGRFVETVRANGQPLRSWNGLWLFWNGTYYQRLSNEDLRDDLYALLGDVIYIGSEGKPLKWKPNQRKLNDVIDAARGLVKLPNGTQAFSWLDGRDEMVIPCGNGLLRISDRTWLPHTPDYFNLFALPYDYDTDATCPRWMQFLDEVLGDDTQSVELLQEWFIYVLSGRTDLHKMLMVIGPKRGGKGTIARLMKRLIGPAGYAGLKVTDLKSNFVLQDKIDKSLVVFPDERQVFAPDGKRLVQFILETTGEDDMHVDIKYRPPWNGRLPMRLMYMGNEMPVLPDASGAVLSRLLVIETTVTFCGKEDRKLETILAGELSGILNWALDGLDRLQKRGEFVQPESGAELLADIDAYSNPVRQFLSGQCVLANGQRTLAQRVYDMFDLWCTENGIERHRSAGWFGRQLRAAMRDLAPDVRFEHKQSGGRNDRSWYYHGIGLRPPDSDHGSRPHDVTR